MKDWKLIVKRGFDLAGAGLGLLCFSPIFIAIAVVLRLTLGRPVFFTQRRPGLHGKPFQLCKFRTMRDIKNADGDQLPDAERLTKFGRFLRTNEPR